MTSVQVSADIEVATLPLASVRKTVSSIIVFLLTEQRIQNTYNSGRVEQDRDGRSPGVVGDGGGMRTVSSGHRLPGMYNAPPDDRRPRAMVSGRTIDP